MTILEDELQQNFRVSIDDVQQSGQNRKVVRVHVKTPVEKVKLKRVRHLFNVQRQTPPPGFSLELDDAPTDRYRLLHTEREGLTATGQTIKKEDISYIREQQVYSELTLVAEISRYLNLPCLEIEKLLAQSAEGIAVVRTRVNEFNELLYDWVIPRLFEALYKVDQYTREEDYQVELVKIPDAGYYELSAREEMVVSEGDAGADAPKSFHLDSYCFDSNPERELFWGLLRDGRVKRLYFTGMLTHGQSDFFVQYIDPESHTIRSYYPDFLLQGTDNTYIIVEVKGDNQIDAPVVLAKQRFAEQIAAASGMTYRIIKGSDANAGRYGIVLQPNEEALRQYDLLSEDEPRGK
jgi:hypothetical protein